MKPAELKATLKAGKPAFGFMLFAVEGMRWARMYAGSTLDYIIIDWEHASRDRQRLSELIGSVQGRWNNLYRPHAEHRRHLRSNGFGCRSRRGSGAIL